MTQPQARALHQAHAMSLGLSWWSVYESRWTHVTLFDRAAARLTVRSVRSLDIVDPVVAQASEFLGLPPP